MIYLVTNQQELFESDIYQIIDAQTALNFMKDWTLVQFDSETTAGKDTVDRLFFLNEVEARKYAQYLDAYMTDWWLIGPGDSQDKVAFVSNGKVMEEGYKANELGINSRPAMWVSFK